MDDKTYASLLIVLHYLKNDKEYEKEHWEKNGQSEDHIYYHITQLSQWADEVAKDY